MMMEYLHLNIVGAEWIIVVFAALVLILGTDKLPAVARKFGKAAAEFEKAKSSVKEQMSGYNMQVNGPVKTEREKLEAMARTVGVDPSNLSDEEIRRAIRDKMG